LGTGTLSQFTGPRATTLDPRLFRAVPLGGNRRMEIRVKAQQCAEPAEVEHSERRGDHDLRQVRKERLPLSTY
jgi:hypothetical protein